MRNHAPFTAPAGIVLTCAVILTGCTGNSDTPLAEPSANSQDSDAAASFLACLTSSDVEAKINNGGQVLVKLPPQLGGESGISSGDGVMAMEGDEAGNLWVAATESSYFVDTPDIQDAYAACEKKHPDFTQPLVNPLDDPAMTQEFEQQEEDALAFAQCARANGFPQIADPDFETMNGILLPDDFTEADFRSLIETCWDPASTFAFGTSTTATFEPWMILEEFQSAPTS